jgi:hypothetical protein
MFKKVLIAMNCRMADSIEGQLANGVSRILKIELFSLAALASVAIYC